MLYHLCILISLVALLWDEYHNSKNLRYIFKHTTILLILFIPINFSQYSFGFNYPSIIIIGLSLSMMGDIFLMFSEKYFIPGLIAFLTAHLNYIAGFISVDGFHFTWIFINFLVMGIFVFKLLNKNLGELQILVILYISAIAVMAWQAWELYLSMRTYGYKLAAWGTLFFIISDFTLSKNKFLKTIKNSPINNFAYLFSRSMANCSFNSVLKSLLYSLSFFTLQTNFSQNY